MSDVCDYYGRILLSCLSKRYEETFAPFEEIKLETRYEDATKGSIIKHLDDEARVRLRERGLDAIRDGRVALVILAGGQSTRLGKNGNKSLVQITPNGSKTLLQLHLERVKRIRELAGVHRHQPECKAWKSRLSVSHSRYPCTYNGEYSGGGYGRMGAPDGSTEAPDSLRSRDHSGHTTPIVYILTSVFNRGDIQGYLERNDYFGLDRDSVVLLEQKNVPCFFMRNDGCERSEHGMNGMTEGNAPVTSLSGRMGDPNGQDGTHNGLYGGPWNGHYDHHYDVHSDHNGTCRTPSNDAGLNLDPPRPIFETRKSPVARGGAFYASGNSPSIEVLVDSKGIITAPNGNGNIFESLHNCPSFMAHLGTLDHLHVIAVDNALSRPLDPELIGLGLHSPFDVLNKCIKKKEGENLGVFCVGKHPCIVEYSELDRIASSGYIRQNENFYGNICDHLFSGPFLKRIMDSKAYLEMPYHVAKKAIPYWDGTQIIYPDEINGYKLELFIFDIMKFAEKVLCLEVDREDSFAPVKKALDFDWQNNENAVQYRMDRVYKKWLKTVNCTVDGVFCEISPLLSYAGEGLEGCNNRNFTAPLFLDGSNALCGF